MIKSSRKYSAHASLLEAALDTHLGPFSLCEFDLRVSIDRSAAFCFSLLVFSQSLSSPLSSQYKMMDSLELAFSLSLLSISLRFSVEMVSASGWRVPAILLLDLLFVSGVMSTATSLREKTHSPSGMAKVFADLDDLLTLPPLSPLRCPSGSETTSAVYNEVYSSTDTMHQGHVDTFPCTQNRADSPPSSSTPLAPDKSRKPVRAQPRPSRSNKSGRKTVDKPFVRPHQIQHHRSKRARGGNDLQSLTDPGGSNGHVEGRELASETNTGKRAQASGKSRGGRTDFVVWKDCLKPDRLEWRKYEDTVVASLSSLAEKAIEEKRPLEEVMYGNPRYPRPPTWHNSIIDHPCKMVENRAAFKHDPLVHDTIVAWAQRARDELERQRELRYMMRVQEYSGGTFWMLKPKEKRLVREGPDMWRSRYYAVQDPSEAAKELDRLKRMQRAYRERMRERTRPAWSESFITKLPSNTAHNKSLDDSMTLV